jgi:hypothetical protein
MHESLDSRIGRLELENGYPTHETATRLFDELDFQRAMQGFIWALPAVSFHGLHLAHLNSFGAQNGEVVLYKTLADKAGMLTPNLTTSYAMSFWNMADQGPLVVEVPDGPSAGGVLDIWQRPITDIGQTGPDKGEGGKYLVLPPGGEDLEAEGFTVVRSPSNQLWFGTRGLDPDAEAAEALLRRHRLYAWTQRDARPETRFIEAAGRPWSSSQPHDIRYWKYLSDLFRHEPVEDRDRPFFAMLKPLGIEQGKSFAPDAYQSQILIEAAQVGEIMARSIAYEKRFDRARVWPDAHWEFANLVELDQEAKSYTQLDERGSWFYEAIGNSTGMQGRTLGFGQVYLETSKDKAGQWLDGGKTYRLHVPPNPPVKQFWSITLYDNVTRGPVITDEGAADLSSRHDLKVNEDGSVELWFGPKRPERAQNWVKTEAGKGWFPYFRFYGPTEAYFDKTWRLPDIEPVG